MKLSRLRRHLALQCALLLPLVLLPATPAAAAPAALAFRAIIHTGDPAPDGTGRVETLTQATINNAAQVAFGAHLIGSGVDSFNDYAIYAGAAGALKKLGREGNAIPGGGGVYQSLPADAVGAFRGLPRLGDDGSVAFAAAVDPTGGATYADRVGLFTATARIAYQGEALPDLPGRSFELDPDLTNPPALNNKGAVVLGLAATGPEFAGQGITAYDTAIYTGPPGRLTAAAHRGDRAPGMAGHFDTPSLEDYLGFGPPAINDAGQVAFMARVKGQPAGYFDNGFRDGIYRWDPAAGLVKLAAQGDSTADGPLEALYDLKLTPALDNGGGVAFAATVGGYQAILRAGAGGLVKVAREGEAVPGGGSGVFRHLTWQPSLNDAGQIAFAGEFASCATCTDRREGIWLGAPGGTWREVVRTGQATPEGEGVFRYVLGSDYYAYEAGRPNLNQKGALLFHADVGDPGQTKPDVGVYLWDGTALQKVLRTGDSLEDKTVARVSFVTPASPGIRALNDAGQMVLHVGYTDGSAALILAGPPGTLGEDGDTTGGGGKTGGGDTTPCTSATTCDDAPRNLKAARDGETVMLTWEAPTTLRGQLQGYYVYRGESGSPMSDFPLAATGFADQRATPGLVYSYTVRGVYADGTLTAVATVKVAADGALTIWLQVNNTTARVGDQAVLLDVPPQVVDGRTLVPLRFLGNALGATLTWEADTRHIRFELGTAQIDLWVGKDEALVGGRAVTMDVPPQIVDGRTLVPLRFLSENLGAGVVYNPADQSITITHAAAGGR